jgi:hypothetical protein
MFSAPTNPAGASFQMALLNGNARPTIEQSDQTFDVLGMQWRAYHDFGAAAADPKLSVRSAGAG